MELMQAHHQWASRPDDERFTSLLEMEAHFNALRQRSRSAMLSSAQIAARPISGSPNGLEMYDPTNPRVAPHVPTNWAFGQLCQRIKAPAAYLQTLPASLAASNINYGLKQRTVENLGIYTRTDDVTAPDGSPQRVRHLQAVTGPQFGRIYNADCTTLLIDRFGDGVTGDFKVPRESVRANGPTGVITKQNTTLYASDRDMWIMLADEDHRIQMKNRRNGQPGSLARGFMFSNSEVGHSNMWIGYFLFDYMCGNHIIWGVEEFNEIRIRHNQQALNRFRDEVAPHLREISALPAKPVEAKLRAAQQRRIGTSREDVNDYLVKMFGQRRGQRIQDIHLEVEERPIETVWDAVTGVTEYAKTIPYMDERVEIEKFGGKLLDLVVV